MKKRSTMNTLLLCLVLLLVFTAVPALAGNQWVVRMPTGLPFSKCRVNFNEHGPNSAMFEIYPGGSQTWTTGNNGTNTLFYLSGSCYNQTFNTWSALKGRLCNGTDTINMFDASIACNGTVSVNICLKGSVPVLSGDYYYGFCP